MNSLVVLLSLVALASAKPSHSLIFDTAVIGYSEPAAVSHQSRVDIKSTPAVVAAAPIVKTLITEPIVTAPAVAYTAPVVAAIGPSAISHQSRVDFKSSPGVINTYATAPLAYTAFAAPTYFSASLAPPAIAAPGVPVDTPEVIAARAAHFEAKARASHSIHKRSLGTYLSTYTAPLTYAGPVTYSAPTAHFTPYAAVHTPYVAVHTPLIAKTYGVHPW